MNLILEADKIKIIHGLGGFNTSEHGELNVVDGKVVLDKVKAFNRARKMLNSGANTFRILRRGIWDVEKIFDWENDGYWPLLREYVGILHQPFQGANPPSGADVLIEIFDGCSETWMYEDYVKAKKLIRSMFANLGNLPYVKFGVGNELNKDTVLKNGTHQQEARKLCREVVYPEFKNAGKIPFTYGASICHPGTPGPVEWQKYEAEAAWDEKTALAIYRQIHGVMDDTSEELIVSVANWMKHPICVFWSVDGSWKGNSVCDRVFYKDKWQIRPSPIEIKKAIRYWMDRVKNWNLPSGQIKYGFEYIGKSINNDDCVANGVRAISEMHKEKFGVWPENYGKYPLDWVDPLPPEPPTPPEPPIPVPEKCTLWYHLKRLNFRAAWAHIRGEHG
jgi:hypothetical protein